MYYIKRCKTCGAEYHVRTNGDVVGFCEHVVSMRKVHSGSRRHRKSVVLVNTSELDSLVSKKV